VKIVLDTNVLVSGLLKSRGNPALVLELALTGAVQVCHDERILAE
jgi:predicted nucleic acid-binding protein